MQSVGGQYQAPGVELQRVDQYSHMKEGQTERKKKKEYHYDDEEENPGLFPVGCPSVITFWLLSKLSLHACMVSYCHSYSELGGDSY